MSRSNTLDRVGFVGRYREVGQPCTYPDLMMRLKLRSGVNAQFLELALQSRPGRRQIEAVASGTSGSMVKITGAKVKRLLVPQVPESLQAAMVSRIDTLDKLFELEALELEKLQQTRSGLAADLLSGRVRTVAA